ncbi:MAG: Abi family protein [Bacilli bacterium]|nr:Abi family protein [Bacilli bacterium]
MTKEQLMKYISVDSEEEKQDLDFYLDVKGVKIHQEIMDYLKFDFSDGKKIKWSDISKILKKDKKIRDKLYIYLAALEEYIRAYISNKYQDNIYQIFWIDGKQSRNKIKTNLTKGYSLFDVLQNTDFGTLINQVKKLPNEDRVAMFDSNIEINANLDAVNELRNAVSHHKFLLNYDFKNCYVGNKCNNSLELNIINLKQLLPKRYRNGKDGKGGITKDMRKCGIHI